MSDFDKGQLCRENILVAGHVLVCNSVESNTDIGVLVLWLCEYAKNFHAKSEGNLKKRHTAMQGPDGCISLISRNNR